MGSWFSNLSVRKNEDITIDGLERYISQWMAGQQYLPAASEDEADASFAIISGNGSKWFSVYSDLFSFDDPKAFSEFATPMSEALRSDVLGISCFDSDYLYLNLIDTAVGIDAWAGIGSAAGLGIKRRTNLSAWKNKTVDFHRFRESVRKKYVFAEDALEELALCLELPQLYSAASYEYLEELELSNSAYYLHFKLPEQLKTKDPPKFVPFGNSLFPYFLDKPHLAGALNVGGESRGLSVYFLGSYVEQEEISFSDVSFVNSKNNSPSYTPIELKKIRLPDGQWAYHYHDPGYRIPPKVDDRLPPRKLFDKRHENSVTVRFIPHGNPRKILNITVVLMPDKNPDGLFSWNVLDHYSSKAELIARYNDGQYMFLELRDPDYVPDLLHEEDFD